MDKAHNFLAFVYFFFERERDPRDVYVSYKFVSENQEATK